jgi:hypothetical protein
MRAALSPSLSHAIAWRQPALFMALALTAICGCQGKRDVATGSIPSIAPAKAPAAGSEPASDAKKVTTSRVDYRDSIRRLVSAEELLLALTPRMKLLDQAVLNLKIPDHAAIELFGEEVTVLDLEGPGEQTSAEPTEIAWPVLAQPRRVACEDVRLLVPLVSDLQFFQHAKFYLINGRLLGNPPSSFETDVGFSGLARTTAGKWRMVRASLSLVWKPEDQATARRWVIDEWRLNELKTSERQELMFAEVLDSLVPDRGARQRARVSKHWQIALGHYYPGNQARLPAGYRDARFFPISTAEHPGLSVVDADRDGFDDLYVMERWGKNMLLHNRGDGTFTEDAARFGLDIEGRSNAAVFADFDNDGDADAMIARSFERSVYLVQEDGRFVDRSADYVESPLPFEATSVSAADFNGDGLLDVYFSTYHQDDISRRIDADLANPAHRIHQYLTPEQSAELRRRFRTENRSFINQIGPPNILLVNAGDGRFRVADQQAQVALWRNSFQSVWADYDSDGDADLYVANDFAPDNLLRNDGAAGFTDVTHEMGIDALGFAMGASWGDYDNDGRDDLYVSNMYSKAGLRITSQVAGLDQRIAELANGNYLYRNLGSRMQLVSGLKPPAVTVARAGWSWGGQFLDANNDGFLDIYVPCGYYSAPDEYATNIDL